MGKSLLRVIGEREPIYEITHKNSAEEYKKFIMYTAITRNLAFIIPICLVMIAAGVALITFAGLLVGVVVSVCAAVFPAIMALGAYFGAVRYLKKNPWYLDYTNTYRFFDEVLYVKSDNKKKYSENVIAYENLYKIVETYGAYYVFLSKGKVAIVTKKQTENAEEFRDFLIEHIKSDKLKTSLGFKLRHKKRVK